MIERLLPASVYPYVKDCLMRGDLTEIRMREGKPLSIADKGKYLFPVLRDETYTVTKQDIDHVLGIATKHSVYAFSEQIAQGYLSYDGGVRIGVCGAGVYKNGRLFTVKDINSLCIRVPHQIFGCAVALDDIINDFDNTLFLSRPGAGKTTLLRETVRLLSEKGYNIVVIDERNELSATSAGKETLDLGPNTDVLTFSDKRKGYSDIVRAMRPDIIATDEIFGADEVACIQDIVRCGIKFIATLHCENLATLLKDKTYSQLAYFARYFVELQPLGAITSIIDKEKIRK